MRLSTIESRLIRRIHQVQAYSVQVYNKHGMVQRNGRGMFPREVVLKPTNG